MRNVIVGTAGHIDHGKTALVRALTGIDTDRLAEEKRRGISIELGFAHLELDEELRLGFVDVPGHERFVKNMLAGAGGIDVVLLVIAADESIKPQTREHFDICRLLGVQRGLVAVTKADLVDKEILELVRLEVEEFVKGSFLEGAPAVAVSAATGEGLAALREQLRAVALSAPVKDSSRHFRLPVDRAFTMRGFGTVVTGTLVSGSIRREEEVEAHPLGERLRVRGIQVHGAEAVEALAGQRTALNLAGPGCSRLGRGVTLTRPGVFRPTQAVDCLFELLPHAKPLRHGAPVHFHAGTAELIAEVRLLESAQVLRPGGREFVRFLLRGPALLLPGDRFIVRMFSPVVTIGGGTVLEIEPPARRRRKKAAERLRVLAEGTAADRVWLIVRESATGLGLEEIVARTGLLRSEVEEAAADARLRLVGEPQPRVVDRTRLEAVAEQVRRAVEEFHRAHPLQPGMAKEEIRSRLLGGAPAFYLEAVLAASGELAAEGEIVRLATHRLKLKQDEEAALEKIEAAFQRAGLTVPPVAEALMESGIEVERARKLLQLLIRQGRLVKVSEELVFHSAAIEGLRERLAGHKGERFRVPVFKEWTGISRKYAIPLLEYLDRQRVTRREGDERVVL